MFTCQLIHSALQLRYLHGNKSISFSCPKCRNNETSNKTGVLYGEATKKMFVICCGMPRAASTLQYQLLAEVVRMSGIGKGLGWGWDKVRSHREDEDDRVFVVKVHDPNPEIEGSLDPYKTLYAYTYRDIRDAALSMIQWKGSHFNHVYWIRNWIRWVTNRHTYFTSKPFLHVSRYEEWTRDILGEIHRIMHVLGVSLDNHQRTQLAHHLSLDGQVAYIHHNIIEKGKYACDKMLLTPWQIHDGKIGKWKTYFNHLQLSAFDELAGEWFRNHSYSPTFVEKDESIPPKATTMSIDRDSSADTPAEPNQWNLNAIPIVVPLFVPPGKPDDWLQPDKFSFFLYNNVLFIEECPITVITNSLFVKDYLACHTPTFLRERLMCEYISAMECRDLLRELYDVPSFDGAMHLVTTVPKLVALWKLDLTEYVHLDMDTLVVRSTLRPSFGNPDSLFSIPHVLRPWPHAEVHEHLCPLLTNCTSLPIVDDHREVSWINTGVFRMHARRLRHYIREEIYPLYLYMLKKHRDKLREKPIINNGDELLFRIMLLFLRNEQVDLLDPVFNYMPQWLHGISYGLSDARIVHYAGPLKKHLIHANHDSHCPPTVPHTLRTNNPDVDNRIAEIIMFYFQRRQYVLNTIWSEIHVTDDPSETKKWQRQTH